MVTASLPLFRPDATSVMSQSLSSRCLILALVAWGFCAWAGPGTAWASCGDYVQHGGETGFHSGMSVHRSQTTTQLRFVGKMASQRVEEGAGWFWVNEPDTGTPIEDVPANRQGGCSGPTCRGALPTAPGSGAFTVESSRHDCLSSSAFCKDMPQNWLRLMKLWESEVQEKLREGRWERPPR